MRALRTFFTSMPPKENIFFPPNFYAGVTTAYHKSQEMLLFWQLRQTIQAWNNVSYFFNIALQQSQLHIDIVLLHGDMRRHYRSYNVPSSLLHVLPTFTKYNNTYFFHIALQQSQLHIDIVLLHGDMRRHYHSYNAPDRIDHSTLMDKLQHKE